MTSFILNKAEARTVTVETGEEAVEAAVAARFDLILMDMLLPGMDGFEATQTLRARGITAPIIAFTALKDPDEHQRCVDAGCTDLLAKPVQRQELLHCVLSNLSVTPLRSSLADDPEMEDIIQEFVDTLPSTLATVRNCHQNNDLKELLAGARNINAAAGMYGFEPIAVAAQELENLLGGGGDDADATKAAVRTDGSLDPDAMNRAVEDKVEALLLVAQRARADMSACPQS